jgi:hypothetical protein
VNPMRIWIGLVCLALGILGLLDVAGVVDASRAIDQWWPLAVIGWALTDMLRDGISLGASIVVAIGVGLLADQQGWAAGSLVWSVLFVLVGTAILAGLGRRQSWVSWCWNACRPTTAAGNRSDRSAKPASEDGPR